MHFFVSGMSHSPINIFMEVQLVMFLFNKSKLYESAEACALAWFNELTDEHAPIPMWGALAAMEVNSEQEEAGAATVIASHKVTPTTLASQGFVCEAMVVVKQEKTRPMCGRFKTLQIHKLC